MLNPALLQRLSALVLGEPEPETPEQIQIRMRQQAKNELVAKSQRSVILEDLEHSIRALLQYIESKDAAATITRSSNDYSEESKVDTSQRALMMESTEDGKTLLLNDDIAIVNMVCSTLDRCISHGLRCMETNEQETVKFFGIVKWTCTRVDAVRHKQMLTTLAAASMDSSRKVCEVVTSSVEPDLPRSLRGFLAAARAAAGLTHVHTDEGKARAFIRQALNMHVLQASMSMVLSETNMDLLTSYYTEYALFRQRDDVKVFLHLLKTLDELPSFAFLIDDMRLDISPEEMPFTKQLPKLKAQKIHRKAPRLIDPEDMVGGRVRLCEEDEETTLLAEKLVRHHELRSAFNSHKGGNPLSDILEKAAQSQKIEDATVAVLRFLELGYPEYDVFGTSLLDVLCNPFLSGMARFETALGIPDVVEACICYLYEHLDTPGLFQVHLDADHVMELRDSIEQVGGFHKQMTVDAHEVTAILYQYLWELPDSLLTEERMDNWLACGGDSSGMDREEKKVLLKVLINDLPWYSKPLLERLCRLITTALEPCHAEKSGLTVYSVANCLAPLLLRKKHTYRSQEYEDSNSRKYPVGYQHASSVRFRLLPTEDVFPFESQSERMAHESRNLRHASRDAQESAQVISLLIQEQAYVLSDFRDELTRRRVRLQEKVFMLETMRFKMEERIDVGNPAHVRLLKRLWDVLVHDTEENETSIVKSNGEIDVDAMLRSSRWRLSGFHTENPLGGFRGGGLLSLECMIFFLEEYQDKARSMMIRNALPGGHRYPFPVACINVMRMLMKLLMLDEAPEGCSKLVLHAADERAPTTVLKMRIAERVSRTPFWQVFDDEQAFFKMEAMAFMLLDLHWIHSGATQMGFQPVLDATRRQMGWLLEQAPQTVDDMWTKWIEVRERHATKFTPIYQDTTRMTASQESDELVATIQLRQNELRRPRQSASVSVIPQPTVDTEIDKVMSTLDTVDVNLKDDTTTTVENPALAF